MRCSENTFPIALAGTGATASRVVFSYITGMDGMLSTPLATSASFVFLLFPVQRVPRQHRGRAVLHRHRHGRCRRQARRAGQDGRHRQCPVRYDFRQLGGQRGGLRDVHHPHDDQGRLLAAIRLRRGSRGLHGRADDASHPRGGGVHHRRIRQRPLHRSRQGGRHPGLRRLCGPALDHPRGSLQARLRGLSKSDCRLSGHAQRGAALPHPHLHVAV